MKAYYVRERLEFERGIDPKKSMNIGKTHLWNNLKPGDILRIKKVTSLNIFLYVENSSYNIGNYLIIKDIIPQEHGIEVSFIFCKNLEEFKKCLKTKDISAYISDGDFFFTYDDDLDLLSDTFDFLSDIDIKRLLNESINFERGLDPKKAMEIGKHHDNPFNKLENTYNYYNYAMRQDKNGLERLILKKASEFFEVSPEKILSIDSTNVPPNSILYPKNLSKLNIIKKETLKTPDTLPITINLTDKGFAYVLNNDGRIVLGILGTQY
jgi:hypothetical protein